MDATRRYPGFGCLVAYGIQEQCGFLNFFILNQLMRRGMQLVNQMLFMNTTREI